MDETRWKTTDSPLTAVGKQDPKTAPLVGAVFRRGVGSDPDSYVGAVNDDISELLKPENRALAGDKTSIDVQLREMYPPPRYNCVMYEYFEEINLQVSEDGVISGKQVYAGQHTTTYNVWLLHKLPLCTSTDIDAVVETSKEIGRILVSTSALKKMLGTTCGYGSADERNVRDDAGDHDLVISDWCPFSNSTGPYVCTINYNPKAVAMRPRRAARSEYRQRMKPSFDRWVMYGLYHALTPTKWERGHPFYGARLRGPDEYQRHSWANNRLCDYSAECVASILAFNLKLWRHKWWRDHPLSSALKVPIVAALPNLHAVEAECIKEIAKQEEVTKATFEGGNPDNDKTLKEALNRDCAAERQMLTVCKFIRAEAKVLKIKIPRAAKPLKPLKRKKKARKRKARARKRKVKRISPAVQKRQDAITSARADAA